MISWTNLTSSDTQETSAKLSEHHKTMQELQIHSFAIFDAVRSIYSVLQVPLSQPDNARILLFLQ